MNNGWVSLISMHKMKEWCGWTPDLLRNVEAGNPILNLKFTYVLYRPCTHSLENISYNYLQWACVLTTACYMISWVTLCLWHYISTQIWPMEHFICLRLGRNAQTESPHRPPKAQKDVLPKRIISLALLKWIWEDSIKYFTNLSLI